MRGWKTPDKSRKCTGQCLFPKYGAGVYTVSWAETMLSENYSFVPVLQTWYAAAGDLGIQIFFFFLGKPWSCDFNEATGGLDIALECCPLPTHSLYSPSEADLCPGKTHCWQLRPPVYSSLDGVESQQRFHSSFLKHMLFFIDLEDLCETWKQYSILLCKKVFHRR